MCRKAWVWFALSLAVVLPALVVAQVTDQEKADGFVAMFNGTDLTGWEVQGEGAENWVVEDGVIKCLGKGGGWLRTAKEYSDFVWRLEYKISPKGNSGIFIRAPKEGRSSMLGFEMQVMDDNGKPPSKTSAGSLYRLVAPSKNMSKPAGEWNEVEITCKGRQISIVWNGEKTIDVNIDDEELNASAPADNKPNKRASKGYLGLQNHGSVVEYRNLRIKELGEG